MTVAVPLRSVVQIGVGTSPPAGKFIRIVSVEPSKVPFTVPFRSLWHDAQEPSAGSTGDSTARPVIVESDWVSTQVTCSALNESEPLPLHVPVKFPCDAGAGDVGEVDGADGGGCDPHANAIRPAAARTATDARIESGV